jgi:tetratricopeptide (TPR) repeat protein
LIRSRSIVLWIPVLLVAALAAPVSPQPEAAAQASSTWQSDVREEVAAHDLQRALRITDSRLADAPDDEDARFWRARLLGWLGRWPDAEQEYRRLIVVSPANADYLIGLANVRLGQQQATDALEWLDKARARDNRRSDLFVSRGRALRSLGRLNEARESFRTALALSPRDEDALAGLASVPTEARHQLWTRADVDYYNFTSDADAFTESLRSNWTSAWQTDLGARVDNRAGTTAWRAVGSVSRHLSNRTALTFGGSAGPGRDIVSNREMFAGAGKGFQTGSGFLRGVSLEYEQHWLWFDQADVTTLRPAATLYFPHEWEAMVSVTAARSAFANLGADWQPAGSARLSFPVASWVSGRAFYGTGAENFALREQIGSFSAWTVGGGARITLPGGQGIDVTVARQQRDQERVQTTLGIGHGFRF